LTNTNERKYNKGKLEKSAEMRMFLFSLPEPGGFLLHIDILANWQPYITGIKPLNPDSIKHHAIQTKAPMPPTRLPKSH